MNEQDNTNSTLHVIAATDTPPQLPVNAVMDEIAAQPMLFAAERITDVLPPKAYERIGTVSLTAEQEACLDETTPDDEVDIRPDGLIYISHDFIRRKLNKAFGRMQWTLVPGSPLTKRPGSNEYYQRWILFVSGAYASEALGSRTYFENNSQMSIDDIAEAIKSDCLRRCAKDLGVGIEAWNRRFQERWKTAFAVEVSINGKREWRRKDGAPLRGEMGQRAQQSAPIATPAPSRPPEVATQQKVAPAPPAPKPVVAVPDAEKPKPAATPTAPRVTSGGQPILQGQQNFIFALLRKAQLLIGDDGTVAMDWLNQEMGVDLIDEPGKKSDENLAAMIRTIKQSQVAQCKDKLTAAAEAMKGR